MTLTTAAFRRLGLALSLTLLTPLPTAGQTMWLGAGVVRDVQRFAEDEVPNRLDGAATGWSVLGGVRLLEHLAIDAEWIDAGEIEDVHTTTVTIGARPVPITSTLRHRTRTATVLAGFGHTIGRASLAYLLGMSFTTVRREFSTDAASLVLVSPSAGASNAPPVIDRQTAGVAGVQALIRLTPRFSVVAGARFQRLELDPDVSGWSAKTIFGGGWVF